MQVPIHPPPAPPPRLLDRISRYQATPWVLLALSLLTCVLGWYHGHRTARHRAEARFTHTVDDIVERLADRLADYEDTLRATAAFVRTTPDLTRDRWHEYVTTLALRERLPGVAALGFSPRLEAAAVAAHVEAVRREGGLAYTVWPASARDERYPIAYLEPETDLSPRLLGFDVATSDALRPELETARDSGHAVLSSAVQLRRSSREHASAALALIVPVYGRGLPVALPEQRRLALLGFVYAPFRVEPFLSRVHDAEATQVGFSVRAGTVDGPVLHRSGPSPENGRAPAFRTVRTVTAADRPWALVFEAGPGYLAPGERVMPALIALGAVLVNVALAALLLAQRVAGARAEAIAARQSVDLHRSESAFQAVAESARIAIVTADARGRFLYANPTAERILGVPREQLRGVDCVNFVAENDRARLASGLGQFLAGQGRISAGHPIPLRARRHSGEEFPAEISLSWVDTPQGRSITGVIVDLSERERAEAEARVAEERWKVALESTDDGVWDWDVSREVLHGSRRLFEMLGLDPSRHTIAVAEWDALVDPEDFPRMQAALDAHLEGITDRYVAEYRVRRRDGAVHWLLARGRVIARAATGRPLRIVGTCSDVTDRQLAQQTLEFAREQAEQAARSKSDFLAIMSHELRTPMNGVLGMANLLGSTPLSEEQREYLDMIGRSGHALLRLIDDILDFSKIEAGRVVLEQVPCDVGAIVADVVTMLGVQARARGLMLDSVVEHGTPTRVVSDPGRLRQVLFNLVGNAIKFTEVGSVHVHVSCDAVTEGRATLRITVSDTGIGIPEEKQRALFEKFTQADASTTRRFGGTGLGLAISKGLVHGLGGAIGVSSTAGEGSRFWFTVSAPISASAPQAPGPAPLAVRDDVPGLVSSSLHAADAPRVLVAEDNPVNQRVAVRMLEKLGFAVDVAPDGEAAVRMARASAYAAILMDCHMPGVDGFEATRRILEAVPPERRPPILALTAAGAGHDRARCLEVGMDDFLKKPVQMPELRAMLERWVATMPGAPTKFPQAQ